MMGGAIRKVVGYIP